MQKGKRNDDGLSAAARKQRDAEIMQQKHQQTLRTILSYYCWCH
uniref:Small EDRK-rich factor-like N-terminal domain-containing protein n=1 Tax=Sinocyclocheilus rhinocerous TaxID=307959 RepID=A0A673GWD8_9TELE